MSTPLNKVSTFSRVNILLKFASSQTHPMTGLCNRPKSDLTLEKYIGGSCLHEYDEERHVW